MPSNHQKRAALTAAMTVANDDDSFPELGVLVALLTYFSYALIVSVGHIRDFLGKISGWSRYEYGKTNPGYSVLLQSWESFYTRRLYHRIQGWCATPL